MLTSSQVGVLTLLLALRMIVGGLATNSCSNNQKIRLAGIISIIEQNDSKQVIKIGNFRVENGEKTRYFRGQSVAVVGRCHRGVIDFLLSRIWLIEPTIELKDKKMIAENGWLKSGVTLQSKLTQIYQHQLPEPEASLVTGIVLGAKSTLPQKFYDALINTGTVHMVVASGYNLTIVAEVLFYILIYFVSRKWATVVVMGGMVWYCWMTGFGVPVMRALVMGALVLLSKVLGRPGEASWWLIIAVWIMLMWSPEMIESVSFQLSVSATAGLIFVEPILRRGFGMVSKLKLVDILSKTELAPTLSAQILTAPIIWWHFGRISLISPLVNLLVLPLVPMVMLLGSLQLVLGWIIAPFSYALLHLIVVIINFFGK